MGIYIKDLTKENWDSLTIEEIKEKFEVIEVKTPHGRLIDAKLFFYEQWLHGTELNDMPAIIEEED